MKQEDDFDFDFGLQEPASDIEIKLNQMIDKLHQENRDLLVVIDTLQTNLRSAESTIKKTDPSCAIFNVPSYKWCLNFKPGS
jgi:hypothetical protein